MRTNTPYQQEVSPIDALWTLYQSQTKKVQKAFRLRLMAEDQAAKKKLEMEAYGRNFSSEEHDRLCLMAKSIKQSAEEARLAAENGTHVGRDAADFLVEMENEQI